MDLEPEKTIESLFADEFSKKLEKLNEKQFTPKSDPKMGTQIEGTDMDVRAGQDPLAPETYSSLRMQYSAEVDVIQRKLGDLETIRKTLGLSRRQMCRLLLVDPSAWTRWTKASENVPFYVYRALQWYLALIDKDSAWHPQNRFSGTVNLIEAMEIKRRVEKLESERMLYPRAEAGTNPPVLPSSQLLEEQRKGGYWVAFLLIIGLAMGVGFFLGRGF